MGTRSRAAVAAVVFVASLVGAGSSRIAAADPKGDINTKVKEAMESYDLMDYDAAKKALNAAATVARKAKLDKDAIAARVYLDLGIVAFAVPDAESAKADFAAALKIDPKIQIDAAYKSADMAKLLEEARKAVKGSGAAVAPTGDGGASSELDAATGGGDAGGGADCGSVKGLQHNIIDSGHNNAPQPVEAMLGSDVSAAKVSLQYRAEGATDFTEVKLTKSGGCKYTGAIPVSATKGSIVHYFIAAYDGNNKVIAAKGSAGSPNILELSGGGGGGAVKGDEEDPLGKHGGGGGPVASTDDAGVSKGVEAGGTGVRHKLMLGLAVGTGGGYVTGQTEGGNAVKNCCIGASLAVFTPELSYAISPATAVGVAARLGMPIGANVDGHATMAPALLIRLRHGLSPDGDGLRVMGQVGVGILRNTIKLDDPMNGMDTDIVAQGPLLVGGGIGYTKRLSNNLVFLFDASVLAGIAVTTSFGSAPVLNSGVGADLSLGVAFGL